ncbi:hypothetical protein [Ensifer canadensis]
MLSVDADGKLLGQAIHNLFDDTDTDFRPTLESQGAILRTEFIRTAAAPASIPTTSQASASHSLTR